MRAKVWLQPSQLKPPRRRAEQRHRHLHGLGLRLPAHGHLFRPPPPPLSPWSRNWWHRFLDSNDLGALVLQNTLAHLQKK
mmetsp:Transcript_156153/g.500928  ORF Transcript_156153/g.500928 Transcript_156153/m.500928 type:complete len:80 (+) Transcript_156153:737-976(+)